MTVGWGGALIVAACICWGIDNNLTRKLSAADPVQIAMVEGVAAGAINTALSLAHGVQLPKEGTLPDNLDRIARGKADATAVDNVTYAFWRHYRPEENWIPTWR